MIKREIKTFSLKLPDGAEYEANAPFSLLKSMIEKDICTLSDAEAGLVALPGECIFTSYIELSDTDAAKKHIYLELGGVLAGGELWINGKSCGILSSPFRSYFFEIADKVFSGRNTVEIRCNESIEPKQYLTSYGERASEYDTANRVADYGILKVPVIYATDGAFIKEVKIRQEHSDGKVSVFITPNTVGESDDVRVVASLSAPSGKIYFGGAYDREIKISVSDPELWWPRGYGAQSLYKLTVTLYRGADVADIYEKRIGLRKTELSIPEHDLPEIKVNGVKIFSRGAAYVKQSAVPLMLTGDMLENVIRRAAMSNMNTLSVFDENIPLTDSFYDLCDKYGLLVWQSITLPYIAPPAASVFASGVTDAVADGVKRLAQHPSVAFFFLAFAERGCDMMRLFRDAIDEFRIVSLKILKPVLSNCAPDIPFVEKLDDIAKYDERYMFEKDATYAYGKLYTLPSEYTLKSYISNDNYNLFSYSSETQTNANECIRMLENTVKHMKMPYGMGELVYASEISAGYELEHSLKRARFSDKCASAALRQLNDGKKTVSASLIDYFGKPKGTAKRVASAYAPISLNIIPCVNETVFSLSNLSKKDYRGKLVYALYDAGGKCYEEKRLDVFVDSGACETVEKVDFSRHVSDNVNTLYVVYELYDEKGIIASGSEHFVPLKYFEFCDPKITAEIFGMGKKFSVKLNSSAYAYAVKIDFEGLNVNFSDNFVNLYGKTPVVLNFETSEVVTLGELEDKLRIYSPYSIGR